MRVRQSIFLITALAMIALLVACSSSSSTPPPPPAISIAYTGTVPTSLVTVQQTSLTATVSNDTGTGGVNWSVTCGLTGTDVCGTFSASNTASGSAVTYTAPASPTTVTITATAADSTSATAMATITIASPSLADGNYVFSVSGFDGITGAPYSVAGAFAISGGVLTGGEQDFVDYATVATLDTFNPGTSSVSTTADGNLQVVLDTQDSSVGVNGVETFNGTFTCTCKALITEFDTSATASGTLDLQTSTATPSGGYAFGLAGLDFNGFVLAMGGILNVDGAGTISGTGSIFDANDGGSGLTFQGETFGASTVSAADSLGRVTFTLNPTDSTDFPQIILAGYIVDATRIRLVESNDAFVGTTGGSALGQGANTGTFNTIAGDSYVAGLTGFDTNFILQAAGVLTTNADFSVSGNISYNDLVSVTSTPSPVTGGTYTLDPTGRVTMTGVTDGLTTFNLQLYLTGDGHAIAITMDTTDLLAGLGFGQTGPFDATSFSGNYAVSAGGWDVNALGPINAVGLVNADGVSAFTGFTDLNWLFESGPVPDLTLAGTYTAPDSTGTFGGTVTGLDVTNNASADAFTYYIISAPTVNGADTEVIGIETDFNQQTLGMFSQVQ